MQYHTVKDETMRVLEGRCELHIGRQPGSQELEVVAMVPGTSYRIRPGVVHRLVALTDTRIVEVSTPELNDVVRLDDRYGREGTSTP
jgi:mannose-6-phosphate isomerase-like protein (cupin superfamily)